MWRPASWAGGQLVTADPHHTWRRSWPLAKNCRIGGVQPGTGQRVILMSRLDTPLDIAPRHRVTHSTPAVAQQECRLPPRVPTALVPYHRHALVRAGHPSTMPIRGRPRTSLESIPKRDRTRTWWTRRKSELPTGSVYLTKRHTPITADRPSRQARSEQLGDIGTHVKHPPRAGRWSRPLPAFA